jgi:hypothetical protein
MCSQLPSRSPADWVWSIRTGPAMVAVLVLVLAVAVAVLLTLRMLVVVVVMVGRGPVLNGPLSCGAVVPSPAGDRGQRLGGYAGVF